MVRLSRLLLFLALLSGALLLPARAFAWPSLDVKQWLGQPRVKLVAIEFYATWCKPCMKSVPQWKALHAKYRAQGLRLIVISVQDMGGCSAPDWTPDAVVCDEDGLLQKQWRAEQLPQAFLWSWQGNLLVAHGSVEQVEQAVESYFAHAPRILVDEPQDSAGDPLSEKEARTLRKLVRSELGRTGKIEIVADEEERAALRELRKQGYDQAYDERLACKLGAEISPNSRLVVTHRKGKNQENLILELFSVENGCLTAVAKAPVMGGDLEGAVVEAAARLLVSLAGEMAQPGSDSAGQPPAEAQPVATTPPVIVQPTGPAPGPEPTPTATPTIVPPAEPIAPSLSEVQDIRTIFPYAMRPLTIGKGRFEVGLWFDVAKKENKYSNFINGEHIAPAFIDEQFGDFRHSDLGDLLLMGLSGRVGITRWWEAALVLHTRPKCESWVDSSIYPPFGPAECDFLHYLEFNNSFAIFDWLALRLETAIPRLEAQDLTTVALGVEANWLLNDWLSLRPAVLYKGSLDFSVAGASSRLALRFSPQHWLYADASGSFDYYAHSGNMMALSQEMRSGLDPQEPCCLEDGNEKRWVAALDLGVTPLPFLDVGVGCYYGWGKRTYGNPESIDEDEESLTSKLFALRLFARYSY